MPEERSQNGYSKTWMLFESGNVVSVDLSLFSAPRQSARPIDAYVVTEASGTVSYCARRAASAVYDVIQRDCSNFGPMVAGFDFSMSFPVDGESGGLAFAVALAKRLLVKDPGPVAATGVLESSHNGGPIKAVGAIVSKLEAAGMILPPGGWIVYPRENEHELPRSLRNRLENKHLKLCPVSSVAETIKVLFSGTLSGKCRFSRKNEYKKSALFLIVLLFLVSAAIFLWQDSHLVSWKALLQKKNLHENQLISGSTENNDIQIHKDPTISTTDIEPADPDSQITVNLFGKTRLNAEISKILTDKLMAFFSASHYHFESIEKASMSAEVVMLRLEENWVEAKQNYRSNIRVALRNFVYEDHKRRIEHENIEVTVHAKGLVEDMVPLTAQALMNKILNSLFSNDHNFGEFTTEGE